VQIAPVATLSGNSLRQTVHTHRASVHQAAKLVAAILRVARVTAGLLESNVQPTAGFMTHVTCRLTDKNRISPEYGLPLPYRCATPPICYLYLLTSFHRFPVAVRSAQLPITTWWSGAEARRPWINLGMN